MPPTLRSTKQQPQPPSPGGYGAAAISSPTMKSPTSKNLNNTTTALSDMTASTLSPRSPTGRVNYVKDPEAHLNSSARFKNSTTANKVFLPPMAVVKEQTAVTPSKITTTTSAFVPSPPKKSPQQQQQQQQTSTKSPQKPRLFINIAAVETASSSEGTVFSETPNNSTINHPSSNNNNNNKSSSVVNYAKKIPPIKALIKEEKQYTKAIELLDELIGSPTYADLPMFDENHPNPPSYEDKILFELLSLRIECWSALNQFGRVLDDISNAMRVDLQTTLLRADFVVPKLRSMYELGDIQIGLQITTSLEIAVARNGALLEEVTEWKRRFVLASRKKNEVVESNHHGIVIGGRRFAAGAPLCRHGCPDKEPANFFQMDIVMHQLQCQDTFIAMYKLYTEFEGAKLSWKHWARQELRKAIDAAANENWKACRDATRQYLLAQEFSKNGEAFVDSMDTLNRIPNPLQVETTGRFFKSYDRAMTSVDELVEMLVEISKPFCSCMNEIFELRSRRVKTTKNTSDTTGSGGATTETGKTRKNVTLLTVSGGDENNMNKNKNNGGGAAAASINNNNNEQHTTAVVPTVPAPSVSAQLMKVKANIREAGNLREEGNLLFLGRKFRSALKCYDEAIELDPSNSELLFNRTAALYELCEYDAVIAACDKTMELAAKNTNSSDRMFAAKVLARRADALWKMGALDEALVNYQESIDSWDSLQVRTKMIDCSIELGKKKLAIAHSSSNGNNNKNNFNNESSSLPLNPNSFIENIINPKPNSRQPPVPFASCVIVEPMSSKAINKKFGSVSITVFPTQVATASHFFTEAIPIPLLSFANFPFAVVPCKIQHSQNQHQQHQAGGSSSISQFTNNNSNNNSDGSLDEGVSSENFFATLATKSIVSDLSDLPMNSAHHRADIWFNCGSVLVVRKDFQPVTCGQVVQLFELLTELWGFTVSNDEEDQKIAKKKRLEVFSDVNVCRKRLAEKLGKMVDQDGTLIQFDAKTNDASPSASVVIDHDPTVKFSPSVEHSGLEINESNNELLAGSYVINTYSRKEELVKHNKDRDQQQVRMLKEQGNKLYKGRRFRTALLRYDEGLMFDSQNPELLYNRAAALLELAMFELALDSCDRALDAAAIFRAGDSELSSKIKARRNLVLRKLGKFDDVEMVNNPDKSAKMLRRRKPSESNNENDDEQEETHEQENGGTDNNNDIAE